MAHAAHALQQDKDADHHERHPQECHAKPRPDAEKNAEHGKRDHLICPEIHANKEHHKMHHEVRHVHHAEKEHEIEK